jgi:pimeloyl-ACP methyl ester carboxylesterase
VFATLGHVTVLVHQSAYVLTAPGLSSWSPPARSRSRGPCPGIPLTSFADDVAATKRAIGAQEGPVILVGHSYGGLVITEAGNDPKVAGLVYVAAFAPDANQTITEISKPFPPPLGMSKLAPLPNGFLLLTPEGIEAAFAQDLTKEEKALLVAVQPQTAGSIFEAKPTVAAWRTKPLVVCRRKQRQHDCSGTGKEHGQADQRRDHYTGIESCRHALAPERGRKRHRRRSGRQEVTVHHGFRNRPAYE